MSENLRRTTGGYILSRGGRADGEPILLTLDEYEVIRLVDLEQRTHGQCAEQMDISRSTVQEIYESARRKIAACLVYGKPLHITGGSYRICGGQEAFALRALPPGYKSQYDETDHNYEKEIPNDENRSHL